MLGDDERANIQSLIADEGLPPLDEFTFQELVMLAPYSIEKIGSNLACYLRSLEEVLGPGAQLEEDEQ